VINKQVKYQFLVHTVLIMVLGFLVFKPIYNYTSHLFDDTEIELCEDLSENPLEEDDCFEMNDLYYLSIFDYSIQDVTSIIKKSKKRFNLQYIEVYADVLIPPPKFI